MATRRDFQFNILRTLHIEKGCRYKDGIVYQLSAYSVDRLPEVRLIVLDNVNDVWECDGSVLIFYYNRCIYRSKVSYIQDGLRTIEDDTFALTAAIKESDNSKSTLEAICSKLMRSDLFSLTQ